MGITVRRRPLRWVAASALVAVAGFAPVSTMNASPALAAASDECGPITARADGMGTWTCSFVDEFSGSSLDTTKWSAVDTRYSGFRVGDACFSETENLIQRNGELRMSTTRDRRAFVCDSPVGDFATQYLGSGITSGPKFSQAYGKFEARIKFPRTRDAGLHSNFWMTPLKQVYGAWPLSGEIDIAEWFSGAPDHVLPSIHYGGSTHADTGWWQCPVVDVSEYHTYGMEWDKAEMTFSVDGTVCFTRSWTPDGLDAPKPFDQPFTLSIVNGVGGTLGNQPNSGTDFPAVTSVDYVKVWR